MVTTRRGDVVELLDVQGEPFAAYQYDAWGAPILEGRLAARATSSITASLAAEIARAQPLRYASYCYDDHSGLYYVSQRYYDPSTMQFISKDPAEADGEGSPYQYCAGNPVETKDSTGLWGQYIHYQKSSDWCSSLMSFRWLRYLILQNRELDRTPAYAPYNPGGWKYHFNESLGGSLGFNATWRYAWGWSSSRLHFKPRHPDSRVSFAWSQMRDAREYWRASRGRTYPRNKAMQALGRAMHARQDIFAHGSIHPVAHKLMELKAASPDNTRIRPWRIERTKRDTVWWARGFVNSVTNRGKL
jgi:RHS repeat-associated protein